LTPYRNVSGSTQFSKPSTLIPTRIIPDRLRLLRPSRWWSFDKTSFPVLVDFMIDSRRSDTGVEVAYDPGLVTKERIEEFAGLYQSLLHAAARRSPHHHHHPL
jgi:hypothetical protein